MIIRVRQEFPILLLTGSRLKAARVYCTLLWCLFTGNKQTLDIIPKENGINVREELLKFHDTWYSSNIMALAILGKGILSSFTTDSCIIILLNS
jgi:hypothetical protein